MTPLDRYLSRLESELRKRGLDDSRIVEEAREHLVDAIDDGRHRGLSMDEAEREAFERFGTPEIVAAHAVPERNRMMNRFAELLEPVWHRKWWILVPPMLAAAVTITMSHYFLPKRYRSESVIRIQPSRVSSEYRSAVGASGSRVRFQQVTESVLSRTRLERMIGESGLYPAKDSSTPLSDIVQEMRRNIAVTVRTPDGASDDGVGSFNVSVASSDPIVAMKMTERITNSIIEENLREREIASDGTRQFIDSQIAELRGRIMDYEKTLVNLRTEHGVRPLSRADLLPYEVLQARYAALLTTSEDLRIAATVERRQAGERFVVIDPARLPERPVGPSRLRVNLAGTFAGLGIGLIFMWRRSSVVASLR